MILNCEPTSFNGRLSHALETGWIVISDGPSGAQLKIPKRMSRGQRQGIVAGVVLLILFGIGLIFILISILNFTYFTDEKTQFIPR